MTSLLGQSRFLAGVALICLSWAVPALVILLYHGGFTWYFPVVGALLFIMFGYCAWRGERWAYYLLMLLNSIGCFLSFLVIVSPPPAASLVLTVFLLAAGLGGGLLLSLSEGTHTFMGAQRRRFASEARDDERGIIQMPDEPNKTEAGKGMGGCCSILVGIPLVCIFGLGFYIWDFARIKSWGVGAKSVEWLPKQASDITFISGDINRIAEFDINRDSLAKWCDSIGKPLKPVAEGQNASIWRVNPYLKQFGINNDDRSFKTAAPVEQDFSSSSKQFTAGDLFYEDRWSNGGGYVIGYDVSEGRGYYQYAHH